MTREEKIKYLNNFCYTQDFCVDCPLWGKPCSQRLDFEDHSDEELDEAFNYAVLNNISADDFDRVNVVSPKELKKAMSIGTTAEQDGSYVTTIDNTVNESFISVAEAANKASAAFDKLSSIKDSGDRTEFETGAVRDMREGKGRFDLAPLDVMSEYYSKICDDNGNVLHFLAAFQTHGELNTLYYALSSFVNIHIPNQSDETMFLEVAKHFEEGAKKYGENNWQKGIPVKCYIDSAVRHYLKWLRGDEDEPHDRAFCWNIICAIWTCIHKPELNEYGPKEESDEKDST